MLTQLVVNHLETEFLNNATLKQAGVKTGVRIFETGFGFVGQTPTDRIIPLASVSKVIIALDLIAIQRKEVPLTPQMLVELIERMPSRPQQRPDIYNRYKLEIELAQCASKHKNEPEKYGAIIAEMTSLMGQAVIPVMEFFYHCITISSNSATQMAKNLRIEELGLEGLIASYKAIAPTYNMLESTDGNHHWTENLPNCGRISEIANTQHALIERCRNGKANPAELLLAESMLDNSRDFLFCFTHSKKGKNLKRKGWKIYEKTGYYPVNTWSIGLAQSGLPPVLVMATVVSLISPQGEIITFWTYLLAEVAWPWEVITEDGINFPNEWGTQYRWYLKSILPRLYKQVRLQMEQNLKSL